jgi:hypothetical protein
MLQVQPSKTSCFPFGAAKVSSFTDQALCQNVTSHEQSVYG